MQPGTPLKILTGAFARCPATLVADEGDELLVRLTIFGREVEQRIPASDARAPDADPVKIARELVEHDGARKIQISLDAWWRERATLPDDDALADRDAGVAHERELRAVEEDALARRLADVEERARGIDPITVEATLGAEGDHFLPATTRLKHLSAAWRADAALFEAFRAAQSAGVDRRLRAERAGWRRDYEVWAAAHRPSPEARAALCKRALAGVAAHQERLRDAVRGVYGVTLPDALFAYWGFTRSLDDDARAALHDAGVSAGGLLEVLDALVDADVDPSRLRTRDGLDVRLESRFYRDPPELFTIAYGNTDGLHYGLWFDDPREPPRGLASYYARDGGGISLRRRSLLGLVRDVVDEYQRSIDGDPSVAAIEDAAQRDAYRFRAAMLADSLDAWAAVRGGTDDDDPGWAPEVPRFMTTDSAGAVAPGEPLIPRTAAAEASLHALLEGDLDARVRGAVEALERGDATEALCLGRDLHWRSDGDPAREEAARDLLVRAYRALGRDALAEIAEVHHAARGLASAAVLRR